MLEDEKVWMRCYNDKGEEFVITTKSEIDRSIYFLYKLVDFKWKKVSKNQDPSKFEDIIFHRG